MGDSTGEWDRPCALGFRLRGPGPLLLVSQCNNSRRRLCFGSSTFLGLVDLALQDAFCPLGSPAGAFRRKAFFLCFHACGCSLLFVGSSHRTTGSLLSRILPRLSADSS